MKVVKWKWLKREYSFIILLTILKEEWTGIWLQVTYPLLEEGGGSTWRVGGGGVCCWGGGGAVLGGGGGGGGVTV